MGLTANGASLPRTAVLGYTSAAPTALFATQARQRAQMSRALSILLFLCLPVSSAFAQQAAFALVGKEVVEERLRTVKNNNQERAVALRTLFAEAGCVPSALTEVPVKHQKAPNVLCTLRGSSDSVIVVGAHFDHVRTGDGVVDNWSGASLLPSLLQSTSAVPRKHTFVFIGFTAEEDGMIGSEAYLKSLSNEDRSKIRAMVDMDTLGLSYTKVWLSRADKGLVTELARVSQALKLQVLGIDADNVGKADSFSFDKYKIPTITIHSVTQETLPILHSRKDNLSAIRMDDYYDTYRLMAAYLAQLDVTLP